MTEHEQQEARQTRCVQVGTAMTPDEKDSFVSFCASSGMKPAEMIRLLIAKVCPDVEPGERQQKEASRKDHQMIITWHKRDWSALGERAKAEGITRQQWVRKKVRMELHRLAPASKDELLALAASNRELNAIGRNLNQIARHLNETSGQENQMTLAYIQNFARYVKEHTAKVGQLVRANHGRYGGLLDD